MTYKNFKLIKKEKNSKGRAGILSLSHGEVETPVFMPVGTQGTVKAVSNEELKETGTSIVMSNSYHLYLRPGIDIIENAGGINSFMGWKKPTITDSGGFQVFSLSTLRRINSDGVEFRSHIDGSKHFLSPERSMEIQEKIGADIIMCFDECSPYPCTFDYAKRSVDLSIQWAKRCKIKFDELEQRSRYRQLLFGIIQGSVFPELRKESAIETMKSNFSGYAIGGLSVGEPKEEMIKVLDATVPLLPEEKPRYLMGVGSPEDIWEAVERGIDMFDCVLPTRNGRNGQAFTVDGKVNIKNADYVKDLSPIDTDCSCPVCKGYSRAYINHLFRAQEILALNLLSLHNIHFMINLLKNIRESIKRDSFVDAKMKFLGKYKKIEVQEAK